MVWVELLQRENDEIFCCRCNQVKGLVIQYDELAACDQINVGSNADDKVGWDYF